MKIEQPGGARHHAFKFVDGVEGQPHGDAETVAQGGGEQPLPRGRADQREARQIDPHATGRRALADHQIERAVLHRRVEHFLDRGLEPVDLVDEQHVAVLEIGEEGCEIARLGDDRAGGGAEAHAHLPRDDLRQRRLAKPGRAEEQHVIERLAARLGSGNEHAKILARRLLPDEIVEALGAQRGVDVLGLARGGDEGGRCRSLQRCRELLLGQPGLPDDRGQRALLDFSVQRHDAPR